MSLGAAALSGQLWAQDAEETPEETPAPAEEGAGEEAGGAGTSAPGQYWVIDFELKALRLISPAEGGGQGRVYWYMIYTLANPAKEDRQVYLNVTATSENDKRYSDLFLPSVERAIEKKENMPLWGKTDEFDIISKRQPRDPKYHYVTLKAGEKRTCVAVFNRLDPNANKINILVSGLSNEVREVVKEDGARFLEERARELTFERPGDEHAMTLDSFKLVKKAWVRKQVAAAVVASEPVKEK
jgi:hypothetical protein